MLPNYAIDDGGAGTGSSRDCGSASELLLRRGAPMSAQKFNEGAILAGFLEEKTRRSTSTPGGIKKYKCVSEAGMRYGKNETATANQKETQPRWFVDTFDELLDLVAAALAKKDVA